MTERAPRKRAVLVVDDHPLMRDGISQLIDQQPDLRVCGGASSGPEALTALERLEPDLMLVDISLPGMDGIELIKAVRKRAARLPLLVLSMHDESLYAERAVRAGAKGYVMKHASAEILLTAIRRVLDGRVYLSPAMTDKLLDKMARTEAAGHESPLAALSDRELEIFKLVGRGLRTQRISEDLNLSVKTVETYYSRIKQKLHIKDASELLQMAIAWRADLERPEDPR